MRRPAAVSALAAILALAGRSAVADDVDLIPAGVLAPSGNAVKPATSSGVLPAMDTRSRLRLKAFAEDAFSLGSEPRHGLVPYPAPLPVDWQNRTSADLLATWKPSSAVTFAWSDRINVFEQRGEKVVSADTIRNDLREASVTWEPGPATYLEAGRINVRNGAALGFNPTDFFKTRTLVGQAALDPSVLRQNRLGALMVRAQSIWRGGSASVAYAPKVAGPSPIAPNDPVGVDPHFDATNAAHRISCTLSFDLLDLSPQLLGYFELGRSKAGANVSRSIGNAVVAYAEWAGGPEQNLIARAAAFGREVGTLPPSTPALPPTSTNVAFRNDVAAGFSWTLAAAVTLNAEYHFHEAGFARSDWSRWFRLGSTPGAPPPLTGTLWFVRGYASDQQEPVAAHQAFIRVAWPQAIVSELEIDAFAFVSLLDGSALSQVSASYFVSDAWTAALYASANLGNARSEHGSSPQEGNLILQLTRYL
ncbi:MAG TPA: hypothetical protein VK841_03305 [Polyangiaceae bacterium]|jgi:hypothetical protein|nr:hypothetical protein [Polyangiaceae bacterium]